MKRVKSYNENTNTWQDIALGSTGPQGPAGEPGKDPLYRGETAPEDTSLLWLVDAPSDNGVLSSSITRIEVVNEYPSVEEDGVLYIKTI